MPRTRTTLTLTAALCLAACGGGTPTIVDPTPSPIPSPVPSPTPSTQPTPAATPEPEPTPSRNHPPTLTVGGGGACHPTPGHPCHAEFWAEVSDRDGDAVTLEWSGCASGHGFTELCTIDRPGEHTATVTAIDARGARTEASDTARGTNKPPEVHIGPGGPPNPAPANTHYTIAGGEPWDPDDYGMYSNQACPHTKVTLTGPCAGGAFTCGGVGDVFDIDMRTLAGPGTCRIEATVTDPWGLVGRDVRTFQVLAP